jgi:PhnB protein
MSATVNPIPKGQHTVTPHLVIQGAAHAIEFYKKAFNAQELGRMPMPDGRIMHAALKIGDSHIFLADDFPEFGGPRAPKPGTSPVTIHLYVEDVDKVFNQAVAAGAKVTMPLANMFWGDRYGKITDPFGHEWSLASRVEEVPREEMGRRAQAAMAAMNKP